MTPLPPMLDTTYLVIAQLGHVAIVVLLVVVLVQLAAVRSRIDRLIDRRPRV